MFKEGDDNKYVYIVRSGQFQVTKNLYNDKMPNNLKKNLLIKSTTTTKRFQSNFSHI